MCSRNGGLPRGLAGLRVFGSLDLAWNLRRPLYPDISDLDNREVSSGTRAGVCISYSRPRVVQSHFGFPVLAPVANPCPFQAPRTAGGASSPRLSHSLATAEFAHPEQRKQPHRPYGVRSSGDNRAAPGQHPTGRGRAGAGTRKRGPPGPPRPRPRRVTEPRTLPRSGTDRTTSTEGPSTPTRCEARGLRHPPVGRARGGTRRAHRTCGTHCSGDPPRHLLSG